MTVAICFNCGEIKWGAFTLCKKCNILPKNKEDMALSVFLTDHCLDKSILNQIALSIKNGEKVELSSEILYNWIAQIENSGILKQTD